MKTTRFNQTTRLWRLTGIVGASVAALLLTGCVHVGVSEQRLVSKPNMTFSGNALFNYQSRLFQQTEPGAADTGGAAAAGCSSCR